MPLVDSGPVQIGRLSSEESALGGGDDYGTSTPKKMRGGFLEEAALRSALRAADKAPINPSDEAGGGFVPDLEKKKNTVSGFAATQASFQRTLAASEAEKVDAVKYPRIRGFGKDGTHTIQRKQIGPNMKPGTVPWVRPSAKPEDWVVTKIDEDFLKNGPAPPLVQANATLVQSRSMLGLIKDPLGAAILSTPRHRQDYSLYQYFNSWDENMSTGRPMSMSSSFPGSRPYTGQSSKSIRSPFTPGTPRSINRASGTPKGLQAYKRVTTLKQFDPHMKTGNPSAFKIMDFEKVWEVEHSKLSDTDRRASLGFRTYRDRFVHADTLVHGPVTSREGSSRKYGLSPRSPLIRELVMGRPRVLARNRDDIPLVASPPGDRSPITHGSFVPAGPRTVNTVSKNYSASDMNGRGTKYTQVRVTNDNLALPRTNFSEGGESSIPFVNLHSFDETFSSPQRLTPVSRRTLEKAGFETGTSAGGDLSRTAHSPLFSPCPNSSSKRLSRRERLSVTNGATEQYSKETSSDAQVYEHEGARTELLQQLRHDRQRQKWATVGLSRDERISIPGKVHKERMLVDAKGQTEEFEWDDTEKRWTRTYPERPLVRSPQLGTIDKSKSPPSRSDSRSPTLRMPTFAYGAHYICPDDGQASAQDEDAVAKYGLVVAQHKFIENLRTE